MVILLLFFSKVIGWSDSNMAEILAIKDVVLFYVALIWCSSHALWIETDSINAVKWIQDPSNAPWRLRSHVIQLSNQLSKVRNWRINHIRKSANEAIDSLAKEGIQWERNLFLVSS
ncbi:Uncharacterized protein TCM_025492 [Theobroma cacao]|uniref:RNase H type-1 domain-containing protein n=1 Tax=Theobroma cacao TaxID=3641 RepID=A0A061F6I2_THECC|nr:Uncharacterized protein TCM_025492 [Theobroma cacao]